VNTVKAALGQLETVTAVDVELGDGVPSVVRVSSRDELTAGQVQAALNEEGEFTVLDR
jgi:copper chaperone CopZ